MRSAALDLSGRSIDPLGARANARVLVFVRTDCPITNRYAPELARIAKEYAARGVSFWLVYADRAETTESIKKHLAAYQLPGTPLRDPAHDLVRRAHATVAPEAAVFDASGALRYHGRIDDRFVDFGKTRAAARTHDLETAIGDVLAGRAVPEPETRAIGCSLADIQ